MVSIVVANTPRDIDGGRVGLHDVQDLWGTRSWNKQWMNIRNRLLMYQQWWYFLDGKRLWIWFERFTGLCRVRCAGMGAAAALSAWRDHNVVYGVAVEVGEHANGGCVVTGNDIWCTDCLGLVNVSTTAERPADFEGLSGYQGDRHVIWAARCWGQIHWNRYLSLFS